MSEVQLSFFSQVDLDYLLGDGANLTLRALERDGGDGSTVLWILLAVFGLLILAVIAISLWKVPPEMRPFRRRGDGRAENLFLPVDLLVKNPEVSVSGAAAAEKIYLRSIGFNRLVLLTEHPVSRGQEIWLSVKKLPYFHGKKEHIHARLRSSRRLGDHWYVNEASIIHEDREADRELSLFIRDLRAVPAS